MNLHLHSPAKLIIVLSTNLWFNKPLIQIRGSNFQGSVNWLSDDKQFNGEFKREFFTCRYFTSIHFDFVDLVVLNFDKNTLLDMTKAFTACPENDCYLGSDLMG